MGDTRVSRPLASHFERVVDFGRMIYHSPFMVEAKDHLGLRKYIVVW